MKTRRKRSDALKVEGIPVEIGQKLMQRIAPLHRLYWMKHGSLSVGHALLSAYLQGVRDCVLLSERSGSSRAAGVEPGVGKTLRSNLESPAPSR